MDCHGTIASKVSPPVMTRERPRTTNIYTTWGRKRSHQGHASRHQVVYKTQVVYIFLDLSSKSERKAPQIYTPPGYIQYLVSGTSPWWPRLWPAGGTTTALARVGRVAWWEWYRQTGVHASADFGSNQCLGFSAPPGHIALKVYLDTAPSNPAILFPIRWPPRA